MKIFRNFVWMKIWGIIAANRLFSKPIIQGSSSSLINNLLVSILTSCYSDHQRLFLYDSAPTTLVESLWTSIPISVVSYDNSAMFNPTDVQNDKMNLFIISLVSSEDFNITLLAMKNTPWWNIMATIFILDRSEQNCENAENSLRYIWHMNIQDATFLCRDFKNVMMMFTFNPFTDRMPEPWKKVAIKKKEINEHWTLYYQLYNENVEINCTSFHYARWRHLDGYEVKSTLALFYPNSSLLEPTYDPSSLGTADFVSVDVPDCFRKSLNVTLSVYYFEYDFQDPECMYQGLDENLYDLTFGVLPMQAINNFKILYPTTAFETAIIMQKRGYYTPLEKIIKFYGITTVISLASVLCIVLFVVFISNRKRGCAFALFDVLRILKNSGLFAKMDTLPLRIFYFVIFVYCIVMHATFDGNLSSFLTKQEKRKNPETPKDLEAPYIKVIYIPEDVSFDYSNPKLHEKVVLMDNFDCASVILNNSNAACLNDRLDLIALAAQYGNLHVSNYPLASDWFSFIARNDWPLQDRADTVMLWFADFGYGSDLWKHKFTEDDEENIKRANARAIKLYRPVSIIDLNFAFIFLIFNLIIAIIVFFMELAYWILHKRKILVTEFHDVYCGNYCGDKIYHDIETGRSNLDIIPVLEHSSRLKASIIVFRILVIALTCIAIYSIFRNVIPIIK